MQALAEPGGGEFRPHGARTYRGVNFEALAHGKSMGATAGANRCKRCATIRMWSRSRAETRAQSLNIWQGSMRSGSTDNCVNACGAWTNRQGQQTNSSYFLTATQAKRKCSRRRKLAVKQCKLSWRQCNNIEDICHGRARASKTSRHRWRMNTRHMLERVVRIRPPTQEPVSSLARGRSRREGLESNVQGQVWGGGCSDISPPPLADLIMGVDLLAELSTSGRSKLRTMTMRASFSRIAR